MLNPLQNLLDERDRWALWLPVFMGIGIALYFSWATEPLLWVSALACVVLAIAAYFMRGHLYAFFAAALFMVALGHTAATIETRLMAQPMLDDELTDVIISGRVMIMNRLPDGYRLWLEDVQVEGLAKEETPHTVRLKIRYQKEIPEPGKWVSVRGSLYPLSKPAEPGAFDFRRFAYFQGFGGTGYSLGKWRYSEGPPANFAQRCALFFERIRSNIAEKLFVDGNSRETAVASALITGDQSGIDKGTMQAMRVSGISHILSVSGLHITLVAGLVFYTLRALMALVPYFALHWPIKKIAALAALLAVAFYTFMCAAPVPAVRSMVMSGLVLVAIMVDRRALSMRLVAFAAFLGLLGAPSSLLDPSFQLSFGAVMALIAAFEKNEHALWQRFEAQGWLGKIGMYIGGSVITSLVASLATLPFILFHFNQINWYGVITNLIAVPLSSFIIMPAAVVAVLAMPFGWQAGPLWVMRKGIEWMIDSATWVAGWPGAATYHPAMNGWWLVVVIAGGLWFCLWKRKWRYIGLIPFFLGACGFLFAERPDIFVAQGGLLVAVRDAGGSLIARARDREDFNLRVWQQRDGKQGDGPGYFVNWLDAAENGGQDDLVCKGQDCVYTHAGHRVAFPISAGGPCSAELVIGPFARRICAQGAVIDKNMPGNRVVFMKKDEGLRIKEASPENIRRPWNTSAVEQNSDIVIKQGLARMFHVEHNDLM